MKLTAKHVAIKLANPFSISRGTRTHVDVVQVSMTDGKHTGFGECTPYARYNESIKSVLDQIHTFEQLLSAKLADSPKSNTTAQQFREQLQNEVEAGAARNAIDSALWQLEALQTGVDFPAPMFDIQPEIETAMTVSVAEPKVMATQAKDYVEQGATLLKVKLDQHQVYERVAAVREIAPSCKIILDANEAWAELDLPKLFKQLEGLNIAMIEQPVPKGQDELLVGIEHPIPVCADESCHTSADIDALLDGYEMVNIKLDKTGGLTEALKLEQAARDNGLQVMVGCMLGTSLAMKAALPIATRAEIVDLDGPVLLGAEEVNGLKYHQGKMSL
ncbi:dipeptide epimerase [Vibrio sp. T187]|uniref:N-acetyl-D-Glu racemase DgcA n=1 Tax=Vibrio TaxID=662 RepID=UPI0010C9EDF8|nr:MULTISPECIES: N-acetyl-D-Glu racemase DgcA [Vibrio]MBW3698331.1 dipeptide epimerase [Vibrio sp. T187]